MGVLSCSKCGGLIFTFTPAIFNSHDCSDPTNRRLPQMPGERCFYCGDLTPGWSLEDANRGHRWENGTKVYHCRHAAIED